MSTKLRKKCSNGSRKNKKTGNCVKKSEITKRNKCANGFRKNRKTGNCVKKSEITRRNKCANGSRKNRKTGECIKKNTLSHKSKSPSPINKESKYAINSELINMKPKELKGISKNISKQIKDQINELKNSDINKQQKKLNNEYLEELYQQQLAEVNPNKYSDGNARFRAEAALREDFLETIYKISKNKSGKGDVLRLAELQVLYKNLANNSSDNFSDPENYTTKIKLIILSNYK
jgi:hypothetical protein